MFWCIILQNYTSLLSSNDEGKDRNQMKRILLCKNSWPAKGCGKTWQWPSTCGSVCQDGGGSEEVSGWNRSALRESEHLPDCHVTLGICEGDTICCSWQDLVIRVESESLSSTLWCWELPKHMLSTGGDKSWLSRCIDAVPVSSRTLETRREKETRSVGIRTRNTDSFDLSVCLSTRLIQLSGRVDQGTRIR